MAYQNTVFFQLKINNIYKTNLEYEDTQDMRFRGQVYVDLIKRFNALVRWDVFDDPNANVSLWYCAMTHDKLIVLREWFWNHKAKAWEMIND